MMDEQGRSNIVINDLNSNIGRKDAKINDQMNDFTRQEEGFSKPDDRTSLSDAKKLLYGFSFITPNFLQCLNRPWFFLLCVCWLAFAQGMICNGLNNVMLTSIERRYGFTTTQIALFATFFNAMVGLFSAIICYIGHRHRPHTLALGGLTLSVGMVVLFLPQLISPHYDVGVSRDTDTCQFKNDSAAIIETPDNSCEDRADNSIYLILFIIGHSLAGLGNIPVQSLSYAHIEQFADRGRASIYFVAMKTMTIFGPAVGYLIGGPILHTYVDIEQPTNSNLTPDSENWIGAWWIGYLVGAILLLTTVIPLFGFPHAFPNSQSVTERKKRHRDTVDEDKNLKHDFSSVFPSLKRLLCNPTYMFLTLGIACEGLVNSGFSTFFTKFVEMQFNFQASQASIYSGLILIPACGGGMGLGGYLTKRYKWDCRQTLKVIFVLACVSTALIPVILLGCNGHNVVGKTAPYPNHNGNSSVIALNATCNLNCQCNDHIYKPVCSKDGHTYFSPCHAGCSAKNNIYRNCTCAGGDVTEGICTTECKVFPAFVIGVFILLFISFMNAVPLLNGTFWTVPLGLGSFAIGLQQMFLRFLGLIPSPTIFGGLIDTSCRMWHTDSCTGESTSCLEYDNKQFRHYICILGFSVKALSCLLYYISLKTYKLPEHNANVSSDATVGVQNEGMEPDDVTDDLTNNDITNQDPNVTNGGKNVTNDDKNVSNGSDTDRKTKFEDLKIENEVTSIENIKHVPDVVDSTSIDKFGRIDTSFSDLQSVNT